MGEHITLFEILRSEQIEAQHDALKALFYLMRSRKITLTLWEHFDTHILDLCTLLTHSDTITSPEMKQTVPDPIIQKHSLAHLTKNAIDDEELTKLTLPALMTAFLTTAEKHQAPFVWLLQALLKDNPPALDVLKTPEHADLLVLRMLTFADPRMQRELDHLATQLPSELTAGPLRKYGLLRQKAPANTAGSRLSLGNTFFDLEF